MAAPTLTILVPTNDRPEVLRSVWPTWLQQEGLTQVVVVDDGSEVDYSGVFDELSRACAARGVEFRAIRLVTRRGAPVARNAGLPHCKGEDVLTTDDDILLGPDMVSRCREARRELPPQSVCGPRVVYLRDDETEAAAEARSRADRRSYFDPATLTLVPWVTGSRPLQVPFVTAVALWPRSLFDRGLRYFEGYGGNGYREETDPQLRAQAEYGATVHFVPTATVYHLPPRLAYARKSGQRRMGLLAFEWHVLANNARFLRRHGALLRARFEIRALSAWFALLRTRISPLRAVALVRNRRAARRAKA